MSKTLKITALILGLVLLTGCFAGCDMSDGIISPSPMLSPSPSSAFFPDASPSMIPDDTNEPDAGTPNTFPEDMPDNNVPGSNDNPDYDNIPNNDSNAGFEDNSDNGRYFRSPAQSVLPSPDSKTNFGY